MGGNVAINVDYLVVAGGGGGASGGGGAGGLKTGTLSLANGTYAATVGGGGAGKLVDNTSHVNATNGSDSVFSTVTSTGGGGGANAETNGNAGGSGGGAGGSFPAARTGGAGTAGQGNNGGNNPPVDNPYSSAGGGGASAAGNAPPAPGTGGAGGAGSSSSISGSAVTYAGGGGGQSFLAGGTGGAGGAGGGGAGVNAGTGQAGTANRGGGGGGANNAQTGGAGGSGVIILSYLTADAVGLSISGGTITTNGASTVHTFNTSGNFVIAAAAPVADFTGTPTSGTAPLSVTFTDASTNTPTSWLWDFGDSTTSTSQNPTHSYAAGTYTVALTATNAAGSNQKTRASYIAVTPGIQINTGDVKKYRKLLKKQQEELEQFKKRNDERRGKLEAAYAEVLGVSLPAAKIIEERKDEIVKAVPKAREWIDEIAQLDRALVKAQQSVELAAKAMQAADDEDMRIILMFL